MLKDPEALDRAKEAYSGCSQHSEFDVLRAEAALQYVPKAGFNLPAEAIK